MPNQPWPSALLNEDNSIIWHHHVLCDVPRSFAFDDRTLDCHIVWVLTGGHITISTETEIQTLGANSVVWVPPQVTHSAFIPTGQQPLFAYSFRFSINGTIDYQLFNDAIIHTHYPSAAPIAENIYNDCLLNDQWSQQRIRCQLFQLYTQLHRDGHHHNEKSYSSKPERGLTNHQRAEIFRLADKHLSDNLQPRDLANALDLTPDYFTRLFRKSFGRSPRRWIVEHRLARAAYLLQHGQRDISAIANELGYTDANFFSRQFAQHYGTPPSRYH